MARVKKLPYIALAVRSLDETVRFYVENFGGQLLEEAQGINQLEGYRKCYVQVGQMRLYLMEPTRPDSVIARYIETHGEGFHHYCLHVESLSEAVAEFKDKGYRVVERPDYAFIHPKDAHGVLIELAEK